MTTRPGYVWDATASEWVEIGQAAVLAPIKYQTSQPSSPATGDIWIDSDDEVPSVDSTLYYRWTKTMSGGETSLSGTDNNSLALKYTPGYESVFINGVLQVRGSDYVATTGTTVTGLTALTASDVVMVESIIAYSVGDTYTQTTLNAMFSPITTTGAVLLNTTTFSAASSVAIESVFSSTYDTYMVVFNTTANSATDADHSLKLRSGVTDLSTTYYGYGRSTDIAGTATNWGINNATTGIKLGEQDATENGGNAQYILFISAPFLANRTKFTWQGFFASKTGGLNQVQGGGIVYNNTSYDGMNFIASAGTFTGTIKVYGYK